MRRLSRLLATVAVAATAPATGLQPAPTNSGSSASVVPPPLPPLAKGSAPLVVPEDVPPPPPPPEPLARFGLIADVQYANHDDATNMVGNRVRRYRNSLRTLYCGE